MRILGLSLAVFATCAGPAGSAGTRVTWDCSFEGVNLPLSLVYESASEPGLIVRANGVTPAMVKIGSAAFSFIDVTDNGVAQTIVVQTATGAAYYSRGDVFGGELVIVQSQGSCRQE